MPDSLTLSTYPHNMVRLACKKCPRKGQYRKSTLIERFGPDVTMPDLLGMISQCPKVGVWRDPCGAVYVKDG